MDSIIDYLDSFSAGSGVEEEYAQCSCCSKWDKGLIKCCKCPRTYHKRCHIPIPYIYCTRKAWKCTMCKDVTKYVYYLDRSDINDISEGLYCRSIIERLLMELYCDHVYTDFFRCTPNPNIYPEYCRSIQFPKSFDDVRDSLNSRKYQTLRQFLKDLYQVLINAIIFFDPGDPHFNLALEVLSFIQEKQDEWLYSTSIEDLDDDDDG